MPNSLLSKSRKGWWLACAVAALVLIAGIAWRFSSAPQPSPYLLAKVTRGDMEETVLATGTLHPAEQVSVGAQVSGQIKSIRVKLGDHVKAGDLLAEIDPVLQINALRTAQAQLASARAQRDSKAALLVQYRHEEDRQIFMLKRDASSRANFETAQGNVATTQADIKSLDAQIIVSAIQVDNARAQLSYTRITAPMDGDVIGMIAQPGQTVVSAQIVPVLMILANVDTMTIRARISEADVIRVKPGLPVHFSVLGDPDRLYDSQVRAIEPAPDTIVNEAAPQQYQSSQSQTATAVYYNGLFDVGNADRSLRKSMTAQVSIVLGHANQALKIPRAGLGRRLPGGDYEVRVLTADGEPATRQIKVGLTNDTDAQVLSGLAADEQIVVGESLQTPAAQPGSGA